MHRTEQESEPLRANGGVLVLNNLNAKYVYFDLNKRSDCKVICLKWWIKQKESMFLCAEVYLCELFLVAHDF